jgi:hypothetical protein
LALLELLTPTLPGRIHGRCAAGDLAGAPHPQCLRTNASDRPMPTSSVLLLVAALCAFAYAGVAVISGWLLRRAPRVESIEDIISVSNRPSALAQNWIVLLSMFPGLIAYFGAAALIWRVSPPLAALGFVFCIFFVLTELLYRSVELFAVKRVWMPHYLREGDAPLRAMIAGFYDVVEGLYFVLLAGHLLGSALLGIGLALVGGWAVIASVALIINTVRLLLRILEMFVGQRWLAGFNYGVYTPLVFLIFCAFGLGLLLASGWFSLG